MKVINSEGLVSYTTLIIYLDSKGNSSHREVKEIIVNYAFPVSVAQDIEEYIKKAYDVKNMRILHVNALEEPMLYDYIYEVTLEKEIADYTHEFDQTFMGIIGNET